jgi:hypothetical protein
LQKLVPIGTNGKINSYINEPGNCLTVTLQANQRLPATLRIGRGSYEISTAGWTWQDDWGGYSVDICRYTESGGFTLDAVTLNPTRDQLIGWIVTACDYVRTQVDLPASFDLGACDNKVYKATVDASSGGIFPVAGGVAENRHDDPFCFRNGVTIIRGFASDKAGKPTSKGLPYFDSALAQNKKVSPQDLARCFDATPAGLCSVPQTRARPASTTPEDFRRYQVYRYGESSTLERFGLDRTASLENTRDWTEAVAAIYKAALSPQAQENELITAKALVLYSAALTRELGAAPTNEATWRAACVTQ